jgi:hypothetical protein
VKGTRPTGGRNPARTDSADRDRYVVALEIKKVNDVDARLGRQTVGSRYVFHR